MFPDAVSPSPPINPAQRSETISPYKLGMTITSNSDGLLANFMQTVSICSYQYSIVGYSFATLLAVWMNNPSPIFMTPALWQATIDLLSKSQQLYYLQWRTRKHTWWCSHMLSLRLSLSFTLLQETLSVTSHCILLRCSLGLLSGPRFCKECQRLRWICMGGR